MEDIALYSLGSPRFVSKKEKQNLNSQDLSSNLHVSSCEDLFHIIYQPGCHSSRIIGLSTVVIKQKFKKFV